MTDVMVDLETLGTRPTSAIISIGAVEMDFETMELGREFYIVIDKQSCFDIGATFDQSTLDWWSKQDPEAKKVLTEPCIHVKDALQLFAAWAPAGMTLWGNGSDFDNSMLGELYAKAGLEPPWKFYHNRCYRTMKSIFNRVTFMREGVHHHALDDAKSQAQHLLRIMQRAMAKAA